MLLSLFYLLIPFRLTPSSIKLSGEFGLTLQTFWLVDVDKTLQECFMTASRPQNHLSTSFAKAARRGWRQYPWRVLHQSP